VRRDTARDKVWETHHAVVASAQEVERVQQAPHRVQAGGALVLQGALEGGGQRRQHPPEVAARATRRQVRHHVREEGLGERRLHPHLGERKPGTRGSGAELMD
jgi:hypothetical protein